ncbi:MAG: glycosyltransferase family 39 protein [Mucinivorans sp.]
MWNYLKNRPYVLLALLCGLWVVLNLAHAAVDELSGAESYLWYVAQDLDWGYVDHSPLAAVMAWLGVQFGGNTSLAVRLFFVIAQPLALWLFYRVVCSSQPTAKGAITYFIVAFSIPLLQIYGFFASSEIIFMLMAAFVLWAFDGYLRHANWLTALFVALSWALLLVSSSVGLFLIAALIISQYKLLTSWRFYVIIVGVLIFLAPFGVWQISNGWPVVDQFLNPITEASPFGLAQVMIAILLWFNILLIIPFFVSILAIHRGSQREVPPMERTMRVVFWVFVGVMLLSWLRGAKTGLWITPICFSMLYILTRQALLKRVFERYLRVVCWVAVFIFLGFHTLLFLETDARRPLGVVDVRQTSLAAADTLRARGVERLVLQGNERNASAFNFYTKLPSLALPSIYSVASEYSRRVKSSDFRGRTLAIQVSSLAVDHMPHDSLVARYVPIYLGAPSGEVYVSIEKNYTPTFDLRIELENLPSKVLTDSRIGLLLRLENPYPFAVDFGEGTPREVVVVLRWLPFGKWQDIVLPLKNQVVEGRSRTVIATTITIPTVATGLYSFGLTVRQKNLISVYNSKVFEFMIVNPKSKI